MYPLHSLILSACMLLAFLCTVNALDPKATFTNVMIGSGTSTKQLKYPDKLTLTKVSESSPFSIQLSLETNVRYLAVLLDDGNHDVYTVPFDFSGSTYRFAADLASERFLNAINGMPGNYKASLYAVDNDGSSATYPIGTLDLEFNNLFDKYGKTASDSDEFKAQPTIVHVFKSAQPEPSEKTAQLFTALVLAPWLFVLGYWLLIGVNVSGLFSSAAYAFYGLLFMGVLDAWILLFFMYFTVFNIFQLIGYGFVLGIATLFVGRQALIEKIKLKE